MCVKTRKKLWAGTVSRFCCALAAFLLLAVAPPLSRAGENVVWKDAAQLQTDPFGSSSLFPGDSLSGNTLTIPSGTPLLPNAYGGAADKDAVFGNTVTIEGGDVESATGGRSNSGEVYGNAVRMSGGSAFEIIGGQSASGTVRDNSVEIKGGSAEFVTGGYSDSGKVFGNTVHMSGGSAFAAIGGQSESGTVRDNSVEIKGGRVEFATGGDSDSGEVSGNTVRMSGGSAGEIIGGRSNSGEVFGNAVHMSGGSVIEIIGGESVSGTVRDNSVEIKGGNVGRVIGGFSQGDNVIGNAVSVTRSEVRGNITGGRSLYGNANANTVSVTGSTVDEIVAGYSWHGNANANTVSVTGSDVWEIGGGYSENGNASGNTVRIAHSWIGRNVFGGLSYADSEGAMSSNNLISLENVSIAGMVYGGAVWGGLNNKAINNTLLLLGENDLTMANLIGGSTAGIGGDQFTGNTLIVSTDNTVETGTVKNFENYAFNLPSRASDGYVALVADEIAFGDDADRNSRVTTIMHQGGASPLRTGDTITLFQLAEGELDTTSLESLNDNRRVPGGKGVTLLYDFVLNEDGTAEVRNVRANPRARALSEGFLSGVALTSQGADLIAGQGLDAAMRATAAAQRNNGWGIAPFAVLSGGSSRYDTGSHIDLDSFSLMAGLSLGRTLAPCDLTLGLFFEYGLGDYDTHNDFRGGNNVKGGGDASYLGGGLFGRMDFAPTGPGRFHLEASARAGELDTDFSSSALRDMRDRKADYDTSSTYYGLHVGLGYDWSISEQASLDLYGKYFWTHVEGDSVTLPTNDPVHFKDVDSHRLRAGTRFTYAITEWCAPYIGAAWEYEFDGKAEAASYGYSLGSPDLKGSTGIGELGLSFTPSPQKPLSLDLAVQGYTGMREGVSGSIQFRLEF